jgi:hypothetical protein
MTPTQVARQSPLVHETSPQALSPMQSAVQSPLVQLMLPHAFPIPAAAPLQSTSQSRGPQVIVLQALAVEHVMPHDSPSVQSMVLHAFAVLQEMLQFQPLGHEMSPPMPVMLQTLVPKSQLWHVVGHTGASGGAASGVPTTQYPCTQIRFVPTPQSAAFSHW